MLDDLHQLIQSFTAKEIAGLKRFIQQSESQQNFIYQNLFQFLYDAGEEYEEEEVKAFCKDNQISPETLRVHCYHLYNKVMFYLRDPEIRANPEWEIQCLLQDAKTLKLKTLFELSKKTLAKALVIAEECQLPGWQYHIHLAFAEICLRQNNPRGIKDSIEHFRLAKETWKYYNQSEEIVQLNSQVIHQWLQKSPPSEQLARKLKLKKRYLPKYFSFPAKVRYAQSRAIFAQTDLLDQKEMIYWQKLAFDLFSEFPELKTRFPHDYLSAYDNYLMAALQSGDTKLFLSLLDGLGKLDYEDLFSKSKLLALQIYMQLAYWLKDKNITLQVAEEDIDDLIEKLEDQQKVINSSRLNAIIYSIGQLCFLRKNAVAARHWWGDMSYISKSNPLRPDRQRLLILLLLINDYQDEDFDRIALSARINATRNRLRNWNKDPIGLEQHEKITVKHIRKLGGIPKGDKHKKKAQLEKFYLELKEYAENTQEPQVHRSAVILRWLEYQLGT